VSPAVRPVTDPAFARRGPWLGRGLHPLDAFLKTTQEVLGALHEATATSDWPALNCWTRTVGSVAPATGSDDQHYSSHRELRPADQTVDSLWRRRSCWRLGGSSSRAPVRCFPCQELGRARVSVGRSLHITAEGEAPLKTASRVRVFMASATGIDLGAGRATTSLATNDHAYRKMSRHVGTPRKAKSPFAPRAHPAAKVAFRSAKVAVLTP